MPNNNYASGVRLERKIVHELRRSGYAASRTAGSHGLYDVYGLKAEWPVICVQCKRVESVADAKRLIEKFKENPPLAPSKYFHQVLEVAVKGQSARLTVTI